MRGRGKRTRRWGEWGTRVFSSGGPLLIAGRRGPCRLAITVIA